MGQSLTSQHPNWLRCCSFVILFKRKSGVKFSSFSYSRQSQAQQKTNSAVQQWATHKSTKARIIDIRSLSLKTFVILYVWNTKYKENRQARVLFFCVLWFELSVISLGVLCTMNSPKGSDLKDLPMYFSQIKSSLYSWLLPVSLHCSLGLAYRGEELQDCCSSAWEKLKEFHLCIFHITREETGCSKRLQRETQVNKNASGGQMSCKKDIWFCLAGVLWCSEQDHSSPWHLKTASSIPQSPRAAADREADPDGGNNECVWIHVAVLLDLDAFQGSTPYALVTEWIIPRYAGSRLICR